MAGVGLDQLSVRPKLLAADKAFGDAARQHGLEHLPQQIAVAEPGVAVLRKGRGVWHSIGQIETTEPPTGQVQA